ncbi:biosynthetic peptidoglycan transglycosylase [uncultured Clostridium sp.]|jgi:membrane peptidoglycan carboxypeptidase|uniref:biosynthetic peptidoglycan transglycosylase n=1 Tax=uncultured Clostridium sp. TaxID=59620 RepID=UPI00262AA32D|nr:biosynthetic peptidoglycan transglycosylase [uncultured Clostridium sp.]
MKAIKNIIITIITLTILVGLTGAGIIFLKGHEEYKDATTRINLENIVNKVQSNKGYTELKDVSEDFLIAIVAIEDRRFFEHKGIDVISLGRALVNNMKAGEIIEGGSTITQQLAKNLYFSSDQELSRKVAELILAKELEKKYSKDEILELYINVIYYGNDSYGIKEATTGYFNKLPSKITYDEATLLAGVPQAPSYYDLTKNLGGAKEKQKYVEKAITENFK